MKAATNSITVDAKKLRISIHAAREGGDPDVAETKSFIRISIHAAREGGDTIK